MPLTSSERKTQDRVVRLLQSVYNDSQRGLYSYLGNWKDSVHENILPDQLKNYLIRSQNCTAEEAEIVCTRLHGEAACYQNNGLYRANKNMYCNALRYGVKVGDANHPQRHKKTVWPIDWSHPEKNDFAIAEEVTVRKNGADGDSRRPDVVIYVNGLALVVIELKREDVPVNEAMRQHWRNQQDGEIPGFFSTVQLCMAGNDTEGLYYGTVLTPEEYYVRWREDAGAPCLQQEYARETLKEKLGGDVVPTLDAPLLQMLAPATLLWFIHYCVVYDGGVKKVARPNQYFALQAAKERVAHKEGGIIWHSQGSGKSLTMVMLAQWIKETQPNDPRVVIITDRDELDKQITTGFANTGETPVRAVSGRGLIKLLNESKESLICTLVHKFGLHPDDDGEERATEGDTLTSRHKPLYKILEDMKNMLPAGFKAKGNIFCFVDECHRTQGGMLNSCMKQIMGDDAMLIGFTGTPLLHRDKGRLTSTDNFGPYIHTYTFRQAVEDHVVLDLRYQPYDVEDHLSDADKLEQMFEHKTQNLSPKAKEQLKGRWATLKKIYSSKERMRKIVVKILCDMETETPLEQGYGNAMLVAQDIYQAFCYWKLFDDSELKDKCAVVSSYEPNLSLAQGYTGEKRTEEDIKYHSAMRMLKGQTVERYEDEVKRQFVKEPAQMKLLIVVDKLLTGFDAPSCTYLYIDRQLKDHNLFQAVCRVNRLDGERKEYGRIVDFQQLFGVLEQAMNEYTQADLTGGAFAEYDREDVDGLLTMNEKTREELQKAYEKVIRLSEAVRPPKDTDAFCNYFCFDPTTTPADKEAEALLATARIRGVFYEAVMTLTRRYADAAMQLTEIGYAPAEADNLTRDVKSYDRIRHAMMQRSGDYVNLKRYDAEMRALLDRFIDADSPKRVADLDDFSFLDVLQSDDNGEVTGVDSAEEQMVGGERGMAETMQANTRRVINRKRDSNPEEYQRLSDRLERLLQDLRNKAISYHAYLQGIKNLNEELRNARRNSDPRLDTEGKKALYDNLGQDMMLALLMIDTVKSKAQTNWRKVPMRKLLLQQAVAEILQKYYDGEKIEQLTDKVMQILTNNKEF